MSTRGERNRHLRGLEAEMRDHIERETAENVARGMLPAEAHEAALRKFGNVARVMEDSRDVWRWVRVEQFLQDLRYALRYLRRNPRLTAMVVLTLAVGIGVNTAVFSVINTVLLRPLSYPHAGRLVWLADYDPRIPFDFVWGAESMADWRANTRSYAAMAGYGYHQTAIVAEQSVSQVTGVYVIGDFWRITGARPALGRLFDEQESDGIVLSWDLFQRDFGGDPAAVGKPVILNGRPARITGVLPRDFRFQFPMWWTAFTPEPVEAYISLPPNGERMAQGLRVVAELKPGVTPAQAGAELAALERRLSENRNHRPVITGMRVVPLSERLTGGARKALWVLLAAGGFVLLIALVNVANLQLARSTARQKEIAIRAAVGAGRARVVRQLTAESLFQALIAGAAGILLARWCIEALVRISPFAIPRLADTALDGRVLVFTLLLSTAAGIFSGVWPALALWRANLNDELKNGIRTSAGLAALRHRRSLAAVELALAAVLLAGAGLMVKSYAGMMAHPAGFEPSRVITMKLRFGGPRYRSDADARAAFMRELLRRIEDAPGVQSAGVSSWFLRRVPSGAGSQPGQERFLRWNAVSRGYLPALGVHLLRGRWLNATDTAAVLVNESMARQIFGSTDVVGRQVALTRPVTVAGVVADLRYSKLDAPPLPEVYVDYTQDSDIPGADIVARASAGDPAALGRELRKRISAIDPSLPVYDMKTLEQSLAASIAPRRFNLFLLATFASVALLLAVIGIYGVIAYSVAERTREIGLRMALGAARSDVTSMVLREALRIALIGVAAGLAASWAAARVMEGLLYGVHPRDWPTFTLVAVLLALVAVAASVAPALRAASVDPNVALRWE